MEVDRPERAGIHYQAPSAIELDTVRLKQLEAIAQLLVGYLLLSAQALAAAGHAPTNSVFQMTAESAKMAL